MNSFLSSEELKALEAEFITPSMIDRIITDTETGYDKDGTLLFYFIKNVFTDDEIKPLEPTIDLASTFIVSNGRGTASGKLDMTNPLWPKSLQNMTLEKEK